MINEKEIKYLEKIKQLEEENRLLKHRILSNIKIYLFRAKEKLKFN